MKATLACTTHVFSARQAELDNARAASQEACERQLVTEAAAREANLIDFLAAGFAAYERRRRDLTHYQRVDDRMEDIFSTPEEYGRKHAPALVDILKELAGVKPGLGLEPEFLC